MRYYSKLILNTALPAFLFLYFVFFVTRLLAKILSFYTTQSIVTGLVVLIVIVVVVLQESKARQDTLSTVIDPKDIKNSQN